MESLKLRLRHELHIRWPHFSLAILREGRSSIQITHSYLIVFDELGMEIIMVWVVHSQFDRFGWVLMVGLPVV